MVPLENSHSDAELAAVLSYIGEAWHGWSRAVEAREVTAVRSEIAKRDQPWTYDELVRWDAGRRELFRPIALGSAATADGRKGVYLSKDAVGDRVSLRRHGEVSVNGIPFVLPDPAGLDGGRNVIVLRGGVDPKAVSREQPSNVEIPVNQPAGRIHLLGGVAGWGWPSVQAKEAALIVTVHYAGGAEERIELVNGVDIADHNGRIDVPGSARTSLVARGQLRYLWRDLGRPGVRVEKLTLSSPGGGPAPMVAALTMEVPEGNGRLAAAPVIGGRN